MKIMIPKNTRTKIALLFGAVLFLSLNGTVFAETQELNDKLSQSSKHK
jgi:prophage maintenance system killer protein